MNHQPSIYKVSYKDKNSNAYDNLSISVLLNKNIPIPKPFKNNLVGRVADHWVGGWVVGSLWVREVGERGKWSEVGCSELEVGGQWLAVPSWESVGR